MTSESSSSTKLINNLSQSKPVSSSTGDQHNELEHIEMKFDKTNEEYSFNPKHSTMNNTSTSTGGFSLKNPVSSFRSWVSNKKSSKEDSSITTMNHSVTTYGKIDTSPTPRKSSLNSDAIKRTRTNSASATTTSSVTNNYHQQQQEQQQQNQSNSSLSSTTRVKKKSSFTLRNTNPIALLKRTPETNHHQTDLTSSEQTGTGGGGGGPFGYFKHLVRGDSSSSEKKQ
jgi:hypothetical protein